MTTHRRLNALPAALAETARVYPLCLLAIYVLTALNLWAIGGFSPRLPSQQYLVSATMVAWPAAFGALAGALLYLGGPPRTRLIAHAMGFVVGLAGGSWALGSWTVIQNDGPTILSIAVLAYLAAALAAGRAAGGGPGGFWRANLLGLTGLVIGLAVVCASLAGILSVALAIDALLNRGGNVLTEPSFPIGIYFVWPLIALAALRPSALADAARPRAGFLAVLALIADGLVIPVMIALSLVIHLYAAMILVDGALPRGAIGWIGTGYLGAGYGLYMLVDGLPVGFSLLRKAFRLAFVPSTAVPLLLLGLATYARIDQYGITEERYGLVLVVIAGTIILVAAALLRRPFDIRIVPAIVAVLAGIAAAGPIGATATMVRSQIARAQAVLAAVPPNDWATKGIRALTSDQEETVLEVTKALDRRGRLAALTEAPSWPAALPRTWAGLATAQQDWPSSENNSTEPRRVIQWRNVSWEVYPLSKTTLIPAFDLLFDSQESLRSPSGQWMVAARDNRLIVNEDGRETVFDLSGLLPDQAVADRRDIITIDSSSGRIGTLVVQAFDISGPAFTRIRGSILLQNDPSGSAR